MLLATDSYRITILIYNRIVATLLFHLRGERFELTPDSMLISLVENTLRLRRPNHRDIFTEAACLEQHLMVCAIDCNGLVVDNNMLLLFAI